MMTIDHFLLTRFNLPTGGVEARIRASESWLTNRWTLFERYCAPSVAAQTTDDFTWVIYFDPQSPAWLMRAIEPYVTRGLFHPLFRAEVTTDDLLADLRALARRTEGTLLTTNVDNDDAIAVNFLERIQGAVDFSDRRALFVTNGLIVSRDGVYRRRDPRNAFCSVATPWSHPSTSWDDWHIMLDRSMPVVQIDGEPGWMQVVHGENVSNRVRGRLTSPVAWRSLFPRLLDSEQTPGRARLMRDRLVGAPMRGARDTGRTLARRLAIAMVGKDKFQYLKARIMR